ncbi:MAG: hypothetical protein EXR63_03500 [Dehalococcoidia bacterium]|nr:hypothetical protein [Dehalococcoidia bacterium]
MPPVAARVEHAGGDGERDGRRAEGECDRSPRVEAAGAPLGVALDFFAGLLWQHRLRPAVGGAGRLARVERCERWGDGGGGGSDIGERRRRRRDARGDGRGGGRRGDHGAGGRR